MPEEYRVKDFVITTEDIKLAKSLVTRPVEITRFMTEASRGPLQDTSKQEIDLDRASSIAISQDEFAANLRSKKIRKRIEWFSGEDPCCNCANLKLKLKILTKCQIAVFVVWLLVLVASTLLVLGWFHHVMTEV